MAKDVEWQIYMYGYIRYCKVTSMLSEGNRIRYIVLCKGLQVIELTDLLLNRLGPYRPGCSKHRYHSNEEDACLGLLADPARSGTRMDEDDSLGAVNNGTLCPHLLLSRLRLAIRH